ncbi:MAG: tRNA 2-selenouridine(34) synthase MnmH [Cyclobacteriaceae bacterium]|jgi:tRNA 2-selenouridine synthase|nr:tRNA 2-selenouridine(34) synthase MnmH [Cyclobacteriaceae bacterium]
MKSITVADLLRLRHQLPLVDVRAPVEYGAGHIPQASNIPLLTDEHRATVGTVYKKEGQAAAIREGFRLVGPRLADMISDTETIARQGELIVHCWRGGMRSNNFAQFAEMARLQTYVLQGGYKAYRQWGQTLFQKPWRLVLLTGYTGSGKTELLHALRTHGQQVLDLEALARHKGSAFGGLLMPPQPTTEQFQNDLFEALYALDATRPIWVEDESIAIGQLFLPIDFWQQMSQSPLVELHVTKEKRIERLVRDYGQADKTEFLTTMAKIIKRLGGQHFAAAREHLLAGNMPAVMERLLTYYDKAYHASIAKRQDRVILTASWNGHATPAEIDGLLADVQKKLT